MSCINVWVLSQAISLFDISTGKEGGEGREVVVRAREFGESIQFTPILDLG